MFPSSPNSRTEITILRTGGVVDRGPMTTAAADDLSSIPEEEGTTVNHRFSNNSLPCWGAGDGRSSTVPGTYGREMLAQP